MSASSSKDQWQPEFPGQHRDEAVELVFRQHPIVMRKALFAALAVAAIGEMPLVFLSTTHYYLTLKILGAGWLLAILIMFYRWIGWHYSCYILTDSRLIDIHQKGFFNRQVNEVGLNKVQSINYHIKGLSAVLFKYGDITVQTYTGNWLLKMIYHPAEVHSRLIDTARKMDSGFDPSTLAAE